MSACAAGLSGAALKDALLAEMDLFREVTASVAARRDFAVPDHREVEQWLWTELTKVPG